MPLIRNVSLTLKREERLAIVGPNGEGKSTVLKTLAGLIEPHNGVRGDDGNARRVVKDDRVSVGVFSQDLAADLPAETSALEYLERCVAPDATKLEIRNALGSVGLTGDDATRPIGVLSGGEKARVALAGFALSEYNVLMLDEPSNHLDAGSVAQLCEALKHFKGAVVLVTHDRRVIESVATHSVVVKDGELSQVFHGVPQSVLAMVTDEGAASESDAESRATLRSGDIGGGAEKSRAIGSTTSSKALREDVDSRKSEEKAERVAAASERKRLRRAYDQAKKKVPVLERKIEAAEAKMETLQNEMLSFATDVGKLGEMEQARQAIEHEITELYDQYEAAEALAARGMP